MKTFKAVSTHFQKIGLNEMLAADTTRVSSNHMLNAEKHHG